VSSVFDELSRYVWKHKWQNGTSLDGKDNILQASLSHQLLPKDQRTKPEDVCSTTPLKYVTILTVLRQDYPYLSPIIQEIEAEAKERSDLESLTVNKRP
jgi:hypothetical protein